MIKNAVQKHGFNWEKELMANVYRATVEEINNIHYTSKVDLPANLNRLNQCDLSIKVSGSPNTVCMSDCLRVYDAVSSESPYHLVVVHYKQLGLHKTITSIIELDLTNSRELLFGTLTRAQIEDLDRAVKSVPSNRSPTDEEHKHMYAIHKSLKPLFGAAYLNIKCNHTQSRLQCSLNKFQKFVNEHPERVVARSYTNEFQGGSITAEIESTPRQFKKKHLQ